MLLKSAATTFAWSGKLCSHLYRHAAYAGLAFLETCSMWCTFGHNAGFNLAIILAFSHFQLSFHGVWGARFIDQYGRFSRDPYRFTTLIKVSMLIELENWRSLAYHQVTFLCLGQHKIPFRGLPNAHTLPHRDYLVPPNVPIWSVVYCNWMLVAWKLLYWVTSFLAFFFLIFVSWWNKTIPADGKLTHFFWNL